jgi:DNA adenine methylase
MEQAIPYYGGKYYIADWIISFFPKHDVFVDVFGGSGAILLSKPPSRVEVYNDIDRNLTSFFKVLRDKTEELVDYLYLTPVSRIEFERLSQVLNDPNASEFDKAVAVYYISHISWNGRLIYPSFAPFEMSLNKRTKKIETIYNKLPKLFNIAQRFKNVIIENLDYKKVILKYDSPKTLIYMDPPYPLDTRTQGSDALYRFDWTNEQQEEFIDFIINANLQSDLIISSYENTIYNKLLDWGFVIQKKQVPCFGGGNLAEVLEVNGVKVKKMKFRENKPPREEALYIKVKPENKAQLELCLT